MTRSSSGTASPCPWDQSTARRPSVRTLPCPALKVISCVQGAISPLLANIYLHYVLDLWAVRWRRCKATGDMIIVRYADDFIVGFQHERDARCFLDEMRERLGKYALSLHPEKTRLIEFGRFAAERRKRRGLGKPETFNFLGFTFICGRTRAGKFQIKRKTRRDRMHAKLKMIKAELWRRMHQPIPKQGQWLRSVVRGYFNYHAVPTNAHALHVFRHHVTDLWRRTLRRRSQKDRFTWARMTHLVDAWLPKPMIFHPWPSDRFAVTHPRWEPYAGKTHVRFCAGDVRRARSRRRWRCSGFLAAHRSLLQCTLQLPRWLHLSLLPPAHGPRPAPKTVRCPFGVA